jgi:hypothetical protein
MKMTLHIMCIRKFLCHNDSSGIEEQCVLDNTKVGIVNRSCFVFSTITIRFYGKEKIAAP